MYLGAGLTFEAITNLASLGLVSHHPMGINLMLWHEPTAVTYGVEYIVLSSLENPKLQLRLGQVSFTQAGLELAPICGAQTVPDFCEYTLRKWGEQKVAAYSPLPRVTLGID
jgi:hypothetical protein